MDDESLRLTDGGEKDGELIITYTDSDVQLYIHLNRNSGKDQCNVIHDV